MYPEGSENVITFKNIYAQTKVPYLISMDIRRLEVESGTNAPDITGSIHLQLKALKGAQCQKTTATNDETGNVDFGAINIQWRMYSEMNRLLLQQRLKRLMRQGAEPTNESDKIMPVKSEERNERIYLYCEGKRKCSRCTQ